MVDIQENNGINDPRPPLQAKKVAKKSFLSNGRSLVTNSNKTREKISIDNDNKTEKDVRPAGDDIPPVKSTLFPNVVRYLTIAFVGTFLI